MKTTFEQRLKNFIQENFSLTGTQWEDVVCEDFTDMWADAAPEVKVHESIHYCIQGQHDVYFVLEDTVMEIDMSEFYKGEEWKQEQIPSRIPPESFYDLVITDRKPIVANRRIEYGQRLGHLSWSPSYLFHDTNGIHEVHSHLITPTLRPFARYHYIMDFLNRIVTVPYRII